MKVTYFLRNGQIKTQDCGLAIKVYYDGEVYLSHSEIESESFEDSEIYKIEIDLIPPTEKIKLDWENPSTTRRNEKKFQNTLDYVTNEVKRGNLVFDVLAPRWVFNKLQKVIENAVFHEVYEENSIVLFSIAKDWEASEIHESCR